MDEYTVEEIMVTLTKDEYDLIHLALLTHADEVGGICIGHPIFDKFQPQEDNTTQKWWETTESETTETGEQNADHT